MKRLFRWWVANPGLSFLLFGLVALATQRSLGVVSWPAALLALVSAAQALRALWRSSRVLALLLGAAIPVEIIAPTAMGPGPPGAWILLPALPAVLAVATELFVRAARSRRGRPDIEPLPLAATVAAPARGGLHGCLVTGLILGVLIWAWFLWTLELPRLESREFKSRLRVGMSLSDVVVASLETGWHFVNVRKGEGALELRIEDRTVKVGAEVARGETAVRALLERKAGELRVSSLKFMFLTSVPVTSSIVVRFGPDGRVTSIEGPFDIAG